MSIHQSKGLEFPVVAARRPGEAVQHAGSAWRNHPRRGLRPLPGGQAAARGPAISEPAALARAIASAPCTMGRGVAPALRRPDPRPRHLHPDRHIAGKKVGIALDQTRRHRLRPLSRQKVTRTGWDYGSRKTKSGVLELKAEGALDELPFLRWRIAGDAALADKPANEPAGKELPPLDDQTQRKLRETLVWAYPFGAATRRAAKSSVTALRRQAADELDNEAEQVFGPLSSAKRFARTPAPHTQYPKSEIRNPKLSAADTGTAHHKFLQFVALENTETSQPSNRRPGG